MRCPLAILIVLSALSQSLSARDIFVDNRLGDDRNDGGAPAARVQGAGPCRSIARALRLARRGDRVVLTDSGEPYRECITLEGSRHSGNQRRPFVIEGNGAILDGSFPFATGTWEHHQDDVYRIRLTRTSFHQVFLDDRPAARRFAEDFQLPELDPLQWCLLRPFAYFRAEPGRMPHQYNLTHTVHPVGITLYNVRNVVVRNVIVQGYQLDGINAHDSAFGVTIAAVTCRGNGRSGISVGGASRVTLQDSLLGDNGAAQLRTEGHSITRLVNCELLENSAPALNQQGGKVLASQ